MASGLFAAGCVLLVFLALCEARPMLQDSNHATDEATAGNFRIKPRGLMAGACRASDIKLSQGQVSGVGLPTWSVQITNTCTDPLCSISNVIVQCGAFHSGGSLVNPAVFRILDSRQGTCVVNNGNAIGPGEMIAFQYRENFKESLTLKSAQVSCSR